jgi:AmmeMemoRadiSam system protein B
VWPWTVLALLGAAAARMLDYGASGNTSGDRNRVVGYAAVEVRAGSQAQPSVISTS